MSESVIRRSAQPGDMPFIFRSILMGTYHGNKQGKGSKQDPKAPIDFFSSIDQDTFMAAYHTHLEALFSRPGIEIAIAALQSNPDVILGFSVYQFPTLHFVFVKPDWRKIGIATSLIPDGIKQVTGFTRVGDIIRRKKNWTFNPFA